jgi:hypothetical protein
MHANGHGTTPSRCVYLMYFKQLTWNHTRRPLALEMHRFAPLGARQRRGEALLYGNSPAGGGKTGELRPGCGKLALQPEPQRTRLVPGGPVRCDPQNLNRDVVRPAPLPREPYQLLAGGRGRVLPDHLENLRLMDQAP